MFGILATHPYNTRSKDKVNMTGPESDTSIVDPSKEVEEMDVHAMREEMYKLKQQMAKMYQVWAKGHPPPVYPTNPAYIPPLAQHQEPPTMNSSLAFPMRSEETRLNSSHL